MSSRIDGPKLEQAANGFAVEEALPVIDEFVNSLSPSLRELSLKIHSHPELCYEEHYAHNLLTEFMSEHGFEVTPEYCGIETAWRAEWTSAISSTVSRTIGVNSEMDALPQIGHACGHNLIAIAGVGVALALRAAMEKHQLPGKIILLGTPAEEGGAGKQLLLDKGGYEGMDICVMCHPSSGPAHSANCNKTLAMKPITVEYFGRGAHAGAAPWMGTNALDAAFVAYSALSALRQQVKPDHRLHGLIEGNHAWSPNTIPDYAKMRWMTRAQTLAEVEALAKRVQACMEAGATATGCIAQFKLDPHYADLRQNKVLADEFMKIVGKRPDMVPFTGKGHGASTDFGNVSYAMPGLHPSFAIPTESGGGNHTPAYTKASATEEAHEATIAVIKALTEMSVKVLTDVAFYQAVREAFESPDAQ